MMYYQHAIEAWPEHPRRSFLFHCRECDTEILPDDPCWQEPDADFDEGHWIDQSTWLCEHCGAES